MYRITGVIGQTTLVIDSQRYVALDGKGKNQRDENKSCYKFDNTEVLPVHGVSFVLRFIDIYY